MMESKLSYSKSFLDRRKFIKSAGIGAATIAMSPRFAFAEGLNERKIRMGIIGGRFGADFHFHEHPNCIVEAVSDLIPKRREHLMSVYQCNKSYESLEILLKDPKVEAVYIATGVPDHARHTIDSLKAGKHVLCAVPVAMTLEECDEVLTTVKKTGLTYMMAETSIWMQTMISAKEFYKTRAFGNLISAAAQYNHPGIESLAIVDGKRTWRYGFPPIHYITHCTSFLIGLTNERLTEVTCIGWGDNDPICKDNVYDNPFWNGSAFFKTSNGISFRAEVNWKGALRRGERAEWHGDKMSLIMSHGVMSKTVLVKSGERLVKDSGGFSVAENHVEEFIAPEWWRTDMLPKPLQHNSGHDGSHTFITHEFIDAIINNRKPEVDIYQAIAFTSPGIVAHQSALKGGELLKIPSFDDEKSN